MKFTPEARAALEQAGIHGLSRRAFIKGAGAMIVGFSAFGERATAQRGGAGSANALDAWIAVGANGSITAYTGKCELGQGLFTAQAQLIAEELAVAIDRVNLIQCDTARTPDLGTTSGAQSHPTNFNQSNLALAAATAREALIQTASARVGVPVAELVARDGAVVLKSDASRWLTYSDLIGGRTFNVPLNANARRRPANEWTVLGKPVPRIEIPAIATGQFEYVHNVRVPGMLHGQVIRPPRPGAALVAVDEDSIKALPGVKKVVTRSNFVGVVAEKPWQALQAAAALKVTWTPGTALPSMSGFHDSLRTLQPARDTLLVDSGDVNPKLAGAARTVRATYRYPYQMHASMGTSCAVADVTAGEVTIWSATQAVFPLRSSVAMLLGVPAANIRVIFRMASGCYGVNGADTVSYDAALLSQAVSKPVRVQLTRKDEMAWENYGPAFVIDQRAGLDTNGNIIAWDHESWTLTMGGRPGANAPGNVVTGLLAGFQPNAFAARSPAPAPTSYANNSNAVPSYVTGCVGTRCGGTGTVASQRVLTHNVRSPFFTGPLRSPERLQNTFAHESFMDELAVAAGVDPVEFRLRHLADLRLMEVIRSAAKASGWQTRPAASLARRTGIAAGRGLSSVLYEGDNGYCALVAEVEVNTNSGEIAVKRFVIANDSGPISNPDGLRNQLEGGALHGMSRTLGEEVIWDERQVTSVDWRTYPPLYLGPGIPRIETVLIDRPDARAMGAGETAVTLAAAAIGNAVFDATGVRLREVPFTRARVQAGLSNRP